MRGDAETPRICCSKRSAFCVCSRYCPSGGRRRNIVSNNSLLCANGLCVPNLYAIWRQTHIFVCEMNFLHVMSKNFTFPFCLLLTLKIAKLAVRTSGPNSAEIRIYELHSGRVRISTCILPNWKFGRVARINSPW